ncbi:Protein FAR1-RELATED SEQUENCE 5 [Linum perenne]
MKMNDGSAASSSRRADIEDEMLRKWAEEDRVMRGCSSDEDEDEDGDDFEDDVVPENVEVPAAEVPHVSEHVHEGESFHPQNVEGWKKLWFHDFKHSYNAYFNYATREGFAIKIQYRSRSGRKGDTSGRLIYVTLSCRREGFKKGSKLKPKVQIGEAVMDPEPLVQQQRVHAEKRIGCLAKIRFRMNEVLDMYKITQWIGDHNHPMNPLQDQHLMRGNRHLDSSVGHMASINMAAGIGLRSSFEILCKQLGGERNVGCIKVDIKNFLNKFRQKKLLFDEESAINEYENPRC